MCVCGGGGGNHASKCKNNGRRRRAGILPLVPPRATASGTPGNTGKGQHEDGKEAMTFARFTLALLVGRWRAFPVVFRLVLGPGQGGEASVCGGAASLCSLTPCPGPLTPLPRLIARSGTPLSPRVSALPPLCSQGPRRGWFLYTTSLYDGNILPHGGISIAPRPHQGHPWAGPCPHARHGIPHDFPLLARASRPSTG